MQEEDKSELELQKEGKAARDELMRNGFSRSQIEELDRAIASMMKKLDDKQRREEESRTSTDDAINIGGLSNELMGRVSKYLTKKEKIFTAMSVTGINDQCEKEKMPQWNTRFGLPSNMCDEGLCEEAYCGCTSCREQFVFCPNDNCSRHYCKASCGGCSEHHRCIHGCTSVGCYFCSVASSVCCGQPLCTSREVYSSGSSDWTCGVTSPCCGKRYCGVEHMLDCCDGAPMKPPYDE
eukprot:scaffold646_cov131-Skeletonema_dohrnii-CCMP3373.AAC.19